MLLTMNALIEVEENGEVRLPAQFHHWKPHTQLQLRQEGDKLLLEPAKGTSLAVETAALWSARSPAERAHAFRNLIATLPRREGPEIPDEATRRENIYD
jgi:virulence-associated protein VagC